MDGAFRLLFIGDIIGPTGRSAIEAFVPALRRDLRLDAVIANGENSADSGFGITIPIAESLLTIVDFLTLGDHAFDQEEIGTFLDRDSRIIRPFNFDGEKPGRGWGTFRVGDVTVGVANLLGKLFMRPAVQPPYEAADHAVQELKAADADCIIVDMQAEATSEKMGMGWLLDGRGDRRPGHAYPCGYGGLAYPAWWHGLCVRCGDDRWQRQHHRFRAYQFPPSHGGNR